MHLPTSLDRYAVTLHSLACIGAEERFRLPARVLAHTFSVGAAAVLHARTFQNALYPNRHPCRFESSATRMRSRADAKLL
jgi:hypothetical protein